MKKYVSKRIVSIVILICTVFHITCGTAVFAENTVHTNELSYPSNEKESVILLEDTSDDKLSAEELASIVKETKDFSSLSETEQVQIADEYLVNPDIMTDCEEAGYRVSESVELAKIFQNIDISAEQFEEMAKNFGDRETALQQAKLYANYRYTHNSFGMNTDSFCIGYLVSGMYAGDILKARAMAELLETSISDSSLFYGNTSDYGEDELGEIASLFQTKRTAINTYIGQNNLTDEQFLERVTEYLSGILTETGDFPTTFASSEQFVHDPVSYPTAPFEFDQNGTEFINDQTGGVGYQETEAVLPGKNGLDLTIGVRYNTDSSSHVHIFAKEFGIGNILQNMSTLKSMYSPLASFAPGWDFTSSYILYYTEGFDDIYSTLVSSDGSSRSMKESDVEDADKEEIRLYNGKLDLYDVRLYKDSSYTDNGVTSLFCAKYKDGKKEYFDAQGKLMKTENRYRDKITYRYYTNGSEISYIDQHYNKVEITDTLNQVTIIEKTAQLTEYDSSGNEVYIQPMTVTLPDQSVITYRLRDSKHPQSTASRALVQVLESKTNQEGMTTSFEYIEDDVSEFSFIYDWNKPYGRQAYYAMTAVNHPTGLRTEYTYEKSDGALCDCGDTWDRYHVIERVDIDGANEFNRKTFTYDTDFSYWVKTITTTSTNADGLTTENVYTKCSSGSDRARVKKSERVYYMNGDTQVNVSKTEYADYYERTYPQTVTNYVYNSSNTQSLCTIEKYEYDEYGDCTKQWTSYAEGDKTNNEYLIQNTYDTEYHYLTQSTYKKDADTTVKEVYTPTEDHKNIQRAETYINNALTSKTDYSYDENSAFPNAQMVYRSTDLGDSVTTTFEYLNRTFKTKETTNGKSTHYTYDIYGNVLTQTNPNGNTVSYTYDKLGRQTKITYPDNTTDQFVYLLQNTSGNMINRVTKTLQNGARTEYNYDSFGRISNVKDLTLGVVNETHTYDNMGRILKTTLSDGSYLSYAYDITGRKSGQSICNASNAIVYQQSYTYQDAYDTNTSKTTTATGTGANAVKTAVYTDKHGNKVREDLGDTGKLTESKRYTYDYTGTAVSEIFRTTETGSDMVRSSTTLAGDDSDGTITTVKDYYNHETKTYRNMAGQEYDVVDGNGNHTLYAYNADGRVASKTVTIDGGLSITQYTYDNNGNVTCESITDNKPGEATTVRNTYTAYDAMDRPIRVWGNEGGETRYTYDSLGNVLTMTTGITESTPQGKTTTYEYDTRGRLTKTTDPMGYTEVNVYDNRDHLIQVTDKNGSVTQNTYKDDRRQGDGSIVLTELVIYAIILLR